MGEELKCAACLKPVEDFEVMDDGLCECCAELAYLAGQFGYVEVRRCLDALRAVWKKAANDKGHGLTVGPDGWLTNRASSDSKHDDWHPLTEVDQFQKALAEEAREHGKKQ